MKLGYFLFLSLTLSVYTSVYCQSKYEYFLTGNGNLYVPRNQGKGLYPILGYDKETKPKVLIGGFGVGFSAWKKIKPKTSLKWQGNISRSVYWEALQFTDPNNVPIGDASASSTDYSLGLTGTVHYNISKIFSVGSGIGIQTMIISAFYFRHGSLPDNTDRLIGYNHYYKRLMPMLPLELSLKFEKLFVNLRYEHGLLNRFKKDLSEYKKDKYGLLFFELGIRLK